jgi:hypothetical protein
MRLLLISLIAIPTLGLAQTPVVARIVVTPAQPVVTTGEKLQLKAVALDSAGRPVPGATIRFQGSALFAGGVNQEGIVDAGAPGSIPITISAIVEGQRPFIHRMTLRVEPGPATRIVLDPTPAKLLGGQDVRIQARVYSKSNEPRNTDRVTWSSSAERTANVSAEGVVSAKSPGRATIRATTGSAVSSFDVEVLPANIRSIAISPSSPQARSGDVIRFSATVNDASGRDISGLTPVWSITPGEGRIESDGVFVGYRPGTYTVTASFGQRNATTTVTLAPRDVRRPASVVGGLPIGAHHTAEIWLHPTKPIIYLSTFSGIVYTIDASNAAKPVIVDSIVANARLINDLMTSEDGKILVHTRQGASDRKNGLDIYTLEDPLHPKRVAQLVDPVSGGVHSSFVNTQATYGTFVYITSDFQGRVYIIDLNDPANPKVAAYYQLPRTDTGHYVHDMEVRDGLMYASSLNDGLVIVDVGNGIKGGSPSNPQFVSQYKYDFLAQRTAAEAAGRPVIGGTHTAWRYRNYVFVGDEILPLGPDRVGAEVPDRAWGSLHVIDVSDIYKPKEVAWFEFDYGATHNFWVAGDTLYMGAFNAGFRAIDISGELRGDLRAGQREIAHVDPVFPNGRVPNSAFTWGVIVRDGLAYVNDMNNGLTIVKLEPRKPVVP